MTRSTALTQVDDNASLEDWSTKPIVVLGIAKMVHKQIRKLEEPTPTLKISAE